MRCIAPILLRALVLVGCCLGSPLVWGAADEAVSPSRIPTVTRLVKAFMELESALESNIQAGNAAALEKTLTDDFELRTGALPSNPTPRAEWTRQALAKPHRSAAIEQMAVHDLGNHAIVSFLETSSAGGKRDPAKDIFVVDVWKRAGDQWQLAIRYASPAGSRDFVIPGASKEMPIPKKY